MSRRQKTSLPPDLAALILFKADRTCCVCRTPGKPVQIHHIDQNPNNSVGRNLAVLCLDCHTETQVRGGFHRKLDADQVTLYRDDWNVLVAQRRAAIDVKNALNEKDKHSYIKSLTTRLDILRERKQFMMLAMHYDSLGNATLRDKYIDLALEGDHSDDTVIYLRSMQGRQDLIPEETKQREIYRMRSHSDWSQLARLYHNLGEHKDAVSNYCRSVVEDLEEGNVFAAAFYLKELCEKSLYDRLFALAYRQFSKSDDLWWRVRALQELGWTDELKSVLLKNRAPIEKSKHSLLLQQLYSVTGETEKLEELQRKMAETIRIERVKSSE